MRATVWVLAILLSGCSASSINTRDPARSSYGPSNEAATDGEISYCNAGAKFVRNARREDAYKKMHAACDGRYEIVREEDQMAICYPQRRIWFKCES